MNGLTEAVRKYTEHDLIREHTRLPEFPELRTKVLYAFLRFASEKTLHPKLLEAISLAVSLMQHGLDTHELVDGSGEDRRRQMTVLAGDYFSSRFYQLLSQAESVHAIGLVSQAVCEVNRCKMNLYSRAKKLLLSAEDYLRSTVEIDTHLFAAFASWFDGMYRKTCPAVLQLVAECELIARELARTRPDNVKNGWAYWYVMEHGTQEEIVLFSKENIDEARLQSVIVKYNLTGKLADMWDMKITELRRQIRSVGSEKLSEELSRLSEPLFAHRITSRVQEV